MSRMGSSRLWGKIIVLVAVCGWGLSAQAKYGGGSGTEAEPFRISAVSDWQELMATPADWGGHFILTSDIDLNDVPITPIGNGADYFTGVFDGNDYVIRNADVNMPGSDFVGLFGYLGTDGQIKNLGVEDAAIFGQNYVAGLVGRNYGPIINCYSSGSVGGTGYNVGGLVGYNYGGAISNCYSAGSVSGNGGVGGLVGGCNYGTITNCYSTGSVNGNDGIGGLMGYNDGGSISNCYSTGSVSGGWYVGGLVGHNQATISACYSTGSVSGTISHVGGLAGRNYNGHIINCYSTGSVSGTDDNVGGLLGSNYHGTVNSSFWDVNTSGRLASSGGKGATTDQMKSVIIYRNAGWAGKGWVIHDGLDYPRLAWEGTPGVPIPEPEPVPLLGDGTEQSPYQIWTTEDFAILSWHTLVLDKHIELKADLDLAGIATYPIGDSTNQFRGVFDGNDYVIRNADVNIPGGNCVGLFGYVGPGAHIRNIGVEDAAIGGSYRVGGLVGANRGNLTGCRATGSVSGDDDIGGLVGCNYGTVASCSATDNVTGTGMHVGGMVGWNEDGTITASYARGSVAGSSYVGGLVGSIHYGTITDCYATGPVSATGEYVGGLVGEDYCGTISNCYSAGSVSARGEPVGGLAGWSYGGSFTDCFWDVGTSGQTGSSGGTGENTTEMKSIQTYLDAGWDFTIEDGDPADWVMPGNDYPHLAWQYWTSGIVPDVNGLSREEAEIFIAAAPFLKGSVTYTISETVPAGYVVNQYPSSGSTGILGVTAIDLVVSCGSQIGAGSGTPDDPYQIETVSDWIFLSLRSDFWNKHFILTDDIDLQGVAALSPVGNRSQPFTGVFDGNRRIIRNVVITMPNSENVGLFGYVDQNGHIRNVGLENIAVTGRYIVGGLVGWNYCGVLTACYTTGSVNGFWAGGLVGHNGYHIERCSYYFDPYCEECGVCRQCWVDIQPASIYRCYSKASVASPVGGNVLGGLVGWNDGTLSACYATGSVTGHSSVGGLVGLNGFGTISNCYSTGSVTAYIGAGGLVAERGNYFSRSTACFWDVETSAQTISAGGKGLTTSQMKSLSTYRDAGWAGAGWVIEDGLDYPRLEWEGAGGVPIPEPESAPLLGNGTLENPYQIWTIDDFALLNQYSSVLDKHIDLMADLDLDGVTISPIGSSNNLPFTGTFDGRGHIIRNVVIAVPDSDYVGLFGYVDPNAQIRNIGIENAAITGGSFVGDLVGVNYYGEISDCYVTGTVNGHWAGGLVGVNFYGSITSCYAIGDVNTLGGSYVGGLVGCNYHGSLSACYAAVNTGSGGEHVGGLVGVNYYGDLTACYASGDVNGVGSYIGGLVGWNEGSITACYATGSVSGGQYVGGLVGVRYYSMLTRCYATGPVSGGGEYVGGLVGVCTSGGLAASFWDVETSGRATSASGIGKTTADMKDPNTFVSAGWDFIGETGNGTEDIWAICEGTNYPRFVYQIPQGDIVCPDGVNGLDYSLLARYWHETECAALDDCEGADIDLSGAVDFGDVAAVAESWLRDVR